MTAKLTKAGREWIAPHDLADLIEEAKARIYADNVADFARHWDDYSLLDDDRADLCRRLDAAREAVRSTALREGG